MGWNRTIIYRVTAVAAVLLPVAYGTSAAQRAQAPAPAPAEAAEQRELLPDQQVQQLLNRLAFGGRPGDAERVRAMGVDRWIALQLTPQRIDDRATDSLMAGYEMLSAPASEIVASFREAREARRRVQRTLGAGADSASKGAVLRELAREDPAALEAARRTREALTDVQSARLARAVSSERQLQEVMVDFWENHFSVFAGKGQTRLYLAAYDRDAIRPNALGKFRDLLGAVAKSPAMLFYLDNWRSAAADGRARMTGPRAIPPARPRRRSGLNENYGRELMELHTLGVDGGYSQKDVIEVARAFTGWSIDPRNGTFIFRPQLHDAGAKIVLGHRLAAGRGMQDGEEVLDILASSPATARFIAKKLVVHFVSDSAPGALVERVAQTYLRTGGDIREMMRTIATSPEFFSRSAYRAKVKTPFELVASALRAMGAPPDPTVRTAVLVGRLGQPIFGRQTPDGWPDHGDSWMNTGAILARINFGLAVANGRVRGASLATWPYSDSLSALEREQQVDGVIRTILGGEASPVTRAVLTSGENPLLSKYADSTVADSTIDSLSLADGDLPGGEGQTTDPRPRRRPVRSTAPSPAKGLAQILGLALGAPEFQRR